MEKGFYHSGRGYWQTTNEPSPSIIDAYPEGTVEVPLKPSSDHDWQNGEWVYVEPVIDPREKWRTSAMLTKTEFVMACVGAGILTQAEAVTVGRGDWPSAMSGFLSYLTQEQAISVQIEWAAQAEISRMNVFVLSLGSWLEMTDAQLDALFGWQ